MDWNEEWNKSIRLTSRERLNTGSFWDERAQDAAPGHFPSGMTEDQLDMIRPEAGQRILEIGPGGGRLTIPLARASSGVTVIEPSASMLRLLEERARSEGLSNVCIVNDLWERADTGALGSYQKLISSFSLFMHDIREQIRRMNAVSEEVFLFVPAVPRIPFEIQEILFGDVMVRHTDHEILSNVAEDMGLRPRMRIMEYANDIGFGSLSEAADNYFDLYNVPEPKQGPVFDYLSSAMEEKDGKFSMRTSRSVGAIWWQKV